jgi:hypothetical protein
MSGSAITRSIWPFSSSQPPQLGSPLQKKSECGPRPLPGTRPHPPRSPGGPDGCGARGNCASRWSLSRKSSKPGWCFRSAALPEPEPLTTATTLP